MSGGHYDYAYRHIETLTDEIEPSTALRKAFKTHLRKVAKACYDIEWVDSGDYGPGDEEAAIKDCLGKDADRLALSEVIQDAKTVLSELKSAIKNVKRD